MRWTVAPRADTELIRGGTAAHVDRTNECLIGRERELAEIHGCLDTPDGPRLVLVGGERGAGRSALLQGLAERLRARGTPALPLGCVPGDARRPLLLALRLVTALEEHRAACGRPRAGDGLAAEALSAVEQGDRAAMEDVLTTALSHPVPVALLIDDVHCADAESLAVLGRLDTARIRPDVRLVATCARQPAAHQAVEALGARPWARSLSLGRLAPGEVTDVVTHRLRALPDPALTRRVHRLSQGVPGAVDAVLAGWTGRGAIRIADGHAFLGIGAPIPVLPDGDRFMVALRELGEPCWTVAGALSVLWALGRPAAVLTAELTGLTTEAVDGCLRALTGAGIVDEVPAPDGAAPRGWTFRVPLTAHAVRERLGPLERHRLSAAAVEALWAAGQSADRPSSGLLDETEAETYLPDRIADAGTLIDRERAVAELTAAADRLYPDPEGRGMLRWTRAAVHLIEQPGARDLALLRYAKSAYLSSDYATARSASEMILRSRASALDPTSVLETASLLVATAAAQEDWPGLSRMAEERWWRELPGPTVAVAGVAGRILSLCLLERWQEVLDLAGRTEPLWSAAPFSRVLPRLYHAVAEYVLGRPERFAGTLDLPEAPEIPADMVYAVTVSQLDMMLSIGDLRGAVDLLAARHVPAEALPPYSAFLMYHLQGRWDEAMALARWVLANSRVFNPAPAHHSLPARTAAILLARGRTTSADRLVGSMRGRVDGPLEHFLDHADAEVQRTLGDLAAAEAALRRGLGAADAVGYVYGTEELLATLAEVHLEAGRAGEAAACLRRLERVDRQLGTGRTRLLCLLTSARLLGGADGASAASGEDEHLARKRLREAVDLARSREQPFETAVTLSAAARGSTGDRALLHEAYELFGLAGAALWRFHTRTAMREAGLAVPGRRQATEENDHLLATLIAEGLTNRQIAAVLRLSEDAVANRLSRFFARTGLRSRTEVVTAVLTGSLAAVPGRRS